MAETVRFVGIDFGTSTSVVSYMDYRRSNGKLVPMNNLQSVLYGDKHLVPTIVFDNTKRKSFGSVVRESDLENSPQFVHKEFKMQLGSSENVSERAKAIELTYDFFQYLADGYLEMERAQGHSIAERQIYVSYPAKWETQQRSMTIDAAEKAFGQEVRCIDAGMV